MATRKRHRPEQIVRKLTAADRLLAEGKDTAAVSRELGVSEATYHRWRNQFGGLKAEDAKRLKDLERENSTLKRLLADAELEKDALREIARGNFLPGDRATPSQPTPPGRIDHARGSRCSVASLAASIRQGPSPEGIPARLPRCPRRRLDRQSQEDSKALAGGRAAGAAAAAPQPRHRR